MSRQGDQVRSLLALAAFCEGGRPTQAAVIGQVSLQIVRDWTLRFHAGGPEGMIDSKPPADAAPVARSTGGRKYS